MFVGKSVLHILTCIFAIVISAFFVVPSKVEAQDSLKKAEKLISSMRSSLDNVAVEIRNATEKSDVSLVNCLKQREGSMKNYVDASLRNQENLRSAYKAKDVKETDRFLNLVDIAYKKVKEIEDKLKECWKGEEGERKTKVIVIKPEGGPEGETIDQVYPEQEQGDPQEGFPPVPPASPFR